MSELPWQEAVSGDEPIRFSVAIPQSLQLLLDELKAKDERTYARSIEAAKLASRIGIDAGVSGRRLAALRIAALLHDLGKLAIPDQILKADGALSEQDFTLVREHSGLGQAYVLEHAPELDLAANFIRWHHERQDGLGYPDGLAGATIPLEARILSVVDAFSALTSDLYHRGALTIAEALEILRRDAGEHWEPRSVALLVQHVTNAGVLMTA